MRLFTERINIIYKKMTYWLQVGYKAAVLSNHRQGNVRPTFPNLNRIVIYRAK